MTTTAERAVPQTEWPVPADAEELWQYYGEYILRLIERQGIPKQEAPDVRQWIFERIIARNVIGMYETGHVTQYKGQPKEVTFKAFLSSIVVRYALGQRDKGQRYTGRELLIADRPEGDGSQTWAEVFGGAWFDDYSRLDTAEFVTRMRTYLALYPPEPAAPCDLAALFDELLREVEDEGKVTMRAVRARFGLSAVAAREQMERLRDAISAAPEGVPAVSWTVGGVTLGPAEVRAAIAILEGSRGIMVAQPLARANHVLGQATRGWYHPFSKEEIKSFPELRVENQSHRDPAGHVKLAVLHRLRRMLAEAIDAMSPQIPRAASATGPVTAAEPVSPMDLIEAELWGLGADASKVDRILGLVRELVPA